MTNPTSRSWFERKIGELAELLRRMPIDRQQAFADTVLNSADATQRNDHAPDGPEGRLRRRLRPYGQQNGSDT